MGRRGGSSNPISLFSFQDIITSVTGIMILVTLMMTLELVQRTMTSPAVQTATVTSEVETTVAQLKQEAADLKSQLERQRRAAESLRGVDPRGLSRQLQEIEKTTAQFTQDIERIKAVASATDRSRKQARQEEQDAKAKQSETRTIEQQIASAQAELEKLKKTNRMIFNPDQGTSKAAWLLDVSGTQIRAAQVGVKAAPTVVSGSSHAEILSRLGTWLALRDPNAEYFVLLIRPSGSDLYVPLRAELQAQGFDIGFDLLGENQAVIDPETGASP